jgi:translation initiation factor IF-2
MAKVQKNKERPPIVVVMGHVDHGKTKLLDYIRKTNVIAGEAGGITQSIGAYEIVHSGKRITFIDTPGHEAFSKMRERGAGAADLAILVVAADEGVKLQTKEALKNIIEAKIPFIVAINKIDKPNSDVERVKTELGEAGVYLEGRGGTISYQEISAATGQGISELLDLLLVAAELEDLVYDPTRPARGFIIEGHTDPARGNTVTAIVVGGALHLHDEIGTKTARGRVRILENFLGKTIESAEPSEPIIIVGFEKLPAAGEEFAVGMVPTAGAAPTLRAPEKPVSAPVQEPAAGEPSVPEVPEAPKAGTGKKEFRVIVRADVGGSAEALAEMLQAIERPNAIIKIVSSSAGDVADGDVNLAISTGSVIAVFNAKVQKVAVSLAKQNNIKILSSPVIYQLLKDVEKALDEAVPKPPQGVLKVLATFRPRDGKQVVGGKVTEGMLKNKASLEIWREGKKVGVGKILNLQAGKKDAGTVEAGNECGILFDGGDAKEGDELKYF